MLAEHVVALPNERRDTNFTDLNMLVDPIGRERTHEEFVILLQSSGLRLDGVHQAGISSIMEAVAA